MSWPAIFTENNGQTADSFRASSAGATISSWQAGTAAPKLSRPQLAPRLHVGIGYL